MSEASSGSAPKFGIGRHVRHPTFGVGKIVAYEASTYVVLFSDQQVSRVSFAFDGLTVADPAIGPGDPLLDAVRTAVQEALGEAGWVDVQREIAKRWSGGVMRLMPGKADTQGKEIPIESLLRKVIGIRDKLRVLEQKINAHPGLTLEDKIELEGYITRSYGSLTSFNMLFAEKESQFKGQSSD